MFTRAATTGLAAVLLLSACADTPTGPARPDIAAAPEGVAWEMADIGQRIEPEYINAHVYGSFRVNAETAGDGGTSIILSGPANFPGHPAAGPGTCDAGRWINASGKGTAGSVEKPHPHCLKSAATMEVVLEPISACYTAFDKPPAGLCRESILLQKGVVVTRLVMGVQLVGGESIALNGESKTVVTIGEPARRTYPSKGLTTIVGYAIDASTLGTTNRRVGTLTIDLLDFASADQNLLPPQIWECSLDDTLLQPCINRVVSATYNPLPAPDGVGSPDTVVEGFLWLSGAKTPYNYNY